MGNLFCCPFLPIRAGTTRFSRPRSGRAISPNSSILWTSEVERVSWRRRLAGGFAPRLQYKNRLRDAGATKLRSPQRNVGAPIQLLKLFAKRCKLLFQIRHFL